MVSKMHIKLRKKKRRNGQQIPAFLAADIICFAGKGDLYSRVGRWLMRMEGEGPTYSVHTAQFLDGRRVLEMDIVGRIKTIEDVLAKRSKLDMWERRGFEVWRCETLTPAQRAAVTRHAMEFVDVRFGMAKFWAHMLDNLIYRAVRRDVFLFRRLDRNNSVPVCSGITASAYDRALNYHFGVPPDCADPDHIHDWLVGHPEEWVRVFQLKEYALDAAAPAWGVVGST
jgi:hypothetical protein